MPALNEHSLGRFCREIAAGLAPLPTLLAEWGLTPTTYDQLRTTPAFKSEMQVIATEIQELGNDAGYVYRMKSLSEEFITTIVDIMREQDTPKSMKFDIIKFCAEMGRLKEKPTPTSNQNNQGPRGPTVIFKLGSGLPVQSIEVTTTEEEQSEIIDVAPALPAPPPPPAEPTVKPWDLTPTNG